MELDSVMKEESGGSLRDVTRCGLPCSSADGTTSWTYTAASLRGAMSWAWHCRSSLSGR